MLILLPPSEGKSFPLKGSVLSSQSLSVADVLSAPRDEVRKRLIAVATGPKRRALLTLGLTPGLADQLDRDARLSTTPCGQAIEIYTGVLYEALGWRSLSPSAKKLGESQLLIISALFGVLRPLDFIPPYRLSMDVTLPKLGGLSAYWRKHLSQALDELEEEVIVDMRSQTYARAWIPNPAITATVRIFVEKSGKRSIVSHMAKKTRGEVARALLSLTKTPRSIDALANVLSDHFEIELVKPATSKKPHFLDVIIRA
jgi:cytoplasmic iron level regulating protein YaaA (DUF328/UPF0246 family)